MSDHVPSALFIFSEEGKSYVDTIEKNPYGTKITSIFFDTLQNNETEYLKDCQHVVVCGPLAVIKEVVRQGITYQFSVGFIPLPTQISLISCYGLPKDSEAILSLALRNNPKDIDIVFCNETLVFFKAVIGRIPLVDNQDKKNKINFLRNFLKRLASLQLLPFTITTQGTKQDRLSTAACGMIISKIPEGNFTSSLTGNKSSLSDGMLTMIMVAPFSIVNYLRLILKILIRPKSISVPDSIGLIRTSQITVQSPRELTAHVDGESDVKIPVNFRIIPKALKINHGRKNAYEEKPGNSDQEIFITKSMPAGKELTKACDKRVPFFAYASEERFNDLFVALRNDARLDVSYFVLMFLSTVLATVGLYMNSASVIIGAMLLAPLMAPIISLAMGLLRTDKIMFRKSLIKIFLGIILALLTGAFLAFISPYQPLTSEMQGRLNPTVLDLIVAVSAGIAGAYTKSYKEILQSLAGVAIAVALVPPLATAGIGIGRLDPIFFSQAFLLFLTNLIGIVLSATFTFRVLGFSPAVRGKRGLLVIALFLIAVSIPLLISFQSIAAKFAFEKGWKLERFMVNGKYLIVQNADLKRIRGNQILTVEILARDQINRSDLNEFKRKVKKNFPNDLIIRAKITYIP